MEIFLIRHGQTEANVIKIIVGRGDHPLNTEGKAQVRRLAKHLKDIQFEAIYTSPSRRALQTAQIILRGRDAVPLIEEAAFDEIDFGMWVGKSIKELMEGEELKNYFYSPLELVIPGGESIRHVQERAVGAVEKIILAHADRRIAIISHADVIKSILIHYLGMPLNSWQAFKIDNASVSVLSFDGVRRGRALVVNFHGDIC